MAEKGTKKTESGKLYRASDKFSEVNTQDNFKGLGVENYRLLQAGGTVRMEDGDAEGPVKNKYIELAK